MTYVSKKLRNAKVKMWPFRENGAERVYTGLVKVGFCSLKCVVSIQQHNIDTPLAYYHYGLRLKPSDIIFKQERSECMEPRR